MANYATNFQVGSADLKLSASSGAGEEITEIFLSEQLLQRYFRELRSRDTFFFERPE